MRVNKKGNSKKHKCRLKEDVIDKLVREGKELTLSNYFKAQLTPSQIKEVAEIVKHGKPAEEKETKLSNISTIAEKRKKLRKVVFS